MDWNELSREIARETGCGPDVGFSQDGQHPWVVAAIRIATLREREACAKAAEGFTDDRKWVPGSLYDTLRRETAAAIRKRSNVELTGAAPPYGAASSDRRERG